MRKTIHVAAVAGSIAVLAALGAAHSGDGKGPVHKDSATLAYKDLSPGASSAAVWGDPDAGAHAAFTKFVPKFEAPLHTHTNDLRIVVVKGAYVFKPEAGDEIRVTPGQYLHVPGGARHRTGSDASGETIFYQESDGKFDLNPVE
jgi:quercetin dioxygenase-like cupin family protein